MTLGHLLMEGNHQQQKLGECTGTVGSRSPLQVLKREAS